MKYLSALFLVFFIQLPAKAGEATSPSLKIPFLELGDQITYPEEAKSFETNAIIRHEISNSIMYFNCRVMPGDPFIVSNLPVIPYPGPERIENIFLKKTGGTEGKNVCPIGTEITVDGECEGKKTEAGIPTDGLSCRFSSPNPFEIAEPPMLEIEKERKSFEAWMRETETIFSFKIGETIQHPENAGYVRVKASYEGRDFSCTMASNDSFKVLDIPWKFGGIKYEIHLEKTEGTPGDQRICPKGSSLTIKAFCDIETNDVWCP